MRKRSALVVLGLVLIPVTLARAGDGRASAPQPHGTSSGPIKTLLGSGIEWAVVRAIQTAAAEASHHDVNVEKCQIQAVEWNEHLIVLFSNPDPSHQWRGCPSGPCRCYEVELTKDGRTVLKAHFSR